jgi:hypothetical protein
VDSDVDLVKASFWLPIGGKGMTPEDGVTIDVLLNAETGALEKAGSWR